MKKFKKVFTVILAIACLACVAIPASAATPYASKSAGSFGTLSGQLTESIGEIYEWSGTLHYEFSYFTNVTTLPGSSAKLIAKVDCKNNATGANIYSETGDWYPGWTQAGYYVQLDHMGSQIRGKNGITVAAFGAHEARYTNSYVVYTSRTYNLYRDHGII